MVQIGNFYYFFFIGIATGVITGLYFLLRNRSRKVQYNTLCVILFLNLGLHFIKLLFPPYRYEFPQSWEKITFINICAASTLLFPFIFLIKKHTVLHDYMYFIGFCGGFGALILPTEAIGKSPFVFDVIRFYLCHMTLISVPLLAAMLNVYRPRLEKAYAIPLLFLAHETIIFINEIILVSSGLIECTTAEFFDRAFRNSSFIFGPLPEADGIAGIITILVPRVFTQDLFGINGGVGFYWPIVWLVIPALIYLPLAYIILAAPFSRKKRIRSAMKKQLQAEELSPSPDVAYEAAIETEDETEWLPEAK